MIKPLVFYFNFYFEEEEENSEGECPSASFGFIVYPTRPISMEHVNVVIEKDWYIDALDKIESYYGVHDWSSSPTEEVEAIGYTTYEISRELAPEVMNLWRQVFVKQAGEDNVSKVVEIGKINANANDTEIFNLINEILK
jgi:hypothetical protein